ncbi:MAG: dihydrofolate reductase family protein [Chloroflexota bacterium]|nr:dihydrofolate reductase family protein [Chloroflexota bacterium]
MKPVLELFPGCGREHSLEGLYLAHDVRQYAEENTTPFVYSNFVTSLDGRIAIPGPTGSGLVVPEQIANPRDWRLFQELAVQADVIISSGRYLRDYAQGNAQDILRVHEDPRFADLAAWRAGRGLSPQPDLAVISGSLDFPIPAELTVSGRRVVVFTSSQVDPDRVSAIESQTGQVVVAGDKKVTGTGLVAAMGALGYQTVYSASGPKVLHLLLESDVLDRLYLTLANRILGGDPFATIVAGDLLQPAVDMSFFSIYLDPQAFDGLGQLLLGYERKREATSRG